MQVGTVDCNVAISACGNGKQLQRALSLLRGMREAEVESDVISYAAGVERMRKRGKQG